MSKDYLTPPALRVLGPFEFTTGTGNSIQAINTYEVPDGALAMTSLTGLIYQLDKESTATAVGASVIAPALGPGRWFLIASAASPGFLSFCTLLLVPIADLAAVANTWTAFTGQNWGTMLLTNQFTRTAATGLLTYNGPSGATYEFGFDASIGNGSSGTSLRIAIAASHNGDVVGMTDFNFQQESSTEAAENAPTMIRAVRRIVLANGDTIQPMVKNVTAGGDSLLVQRAVMTARPSP